MIHPALVVRAGGPWRPTLILASGLAALVTASCAQAPPREQASDSPIPVTGAATAASPGGDGDASQALPGTSGPASAPATAETATPAAPTCVPATQPKPRPKPARRRSPVERAAPSAVQESPPKLAELPAPPGSRLENVRTLPAGSVLSVLGKKVWAPNGDELGRVIDVLIDPQSGAVHSAVIDFGGFLGVGNRKIAVDWSLLQFVPGSDGKQVRLRLNRSQVLAAPEYREFSDHPAEVVAPAGSKP